MTVLDLTFVADVGVRLLGFAVLSGVVATGAAFVYRWVARERAPDGVTILLGLAAVAIWLNTRAALGDAIGGTTEFLSADAAAFTVAAFFVGAITADLGGRVGDRLATDVAALSGVVHVDADVTGIVRAGGRVLRLRLPNEIDDVDGFDPVPAETKDRIAGTTMLFPRAVSVGELEERLAARLATDHGIAHVEVDISADGRIESLAVGRRQAGIGPTLGSGTVAKAIRADPPTEASAGDVVEMWPVRPPEEGGSVERNAKPIVAEVWAVSDDIVTVVVDAADAPRLDPDTTHRLVTLPYEPRRDREVASLLRTSDTETAALSIGSESPIDGMAVGDLDRLIIEGLDHLVVAVERTDDEVDVVPAPDRTLVAGETVHVIGDPLAIRALTDAAAGEPASLAADPER